MEEQHSYCPGPPTISYNLVFNNFVYNLFISITFSSRRYILYRFYIAFDS